MKINTVESQNFAGQVYVIGNGQRKKLTTFAHELNKTKIVRNAKCNIYLAYGVDFFTGNNMVKAFAKTRGFNLKNDAEKMYDKGETSVLSLEAIKSAVERAINSYNKK